MRASSLATNVMLSHILFPQQQPFTISIHIDPSSSSLDRSWSHVIHRLCASMALDIASLGRRSFVSQSALAEVLTAIKLSGELPASSSKSTVKRRREEAAQAETSYGALHQSLEIELEDGSKVQLGYCHPAAFLNYASQTCSGFRKLLNHGRATNPQNSMIAPWRICLYFDEVGPGNQLKTHNRRKLWVVYYSVLEFGGYELSQEHSWMVLTCIRSDIVHKIKGGLSHLFLLCLKIFECLHAGITVHVGEHEHATAVLCFRYGLLIADEQAIKFCLECKGASGKMCCFRCQTTIQARYAPTPLGRMVLHTEHDFTKLVLHSDRSVWQIVDHLATQAGHGTKKAFSELEVRLGWNHEPNGVLLDQQMRAHFKPISHVSYDWMHVYLVARIFHKEISALLDLMSKHGIRQSTLHDWCSRFIWPHLHGGQGCSAKEVFRKKREGDSDFKRTSSEALGIYPVIRSFFDNMNMENIGHDMRLGINSYYCLCEVMDSLKHAATGSIAVDALQNKIEAHLIAFKVP